MPTYYPNVSDNLKVRKCNDDQGTIPAGVKLKNDNKKIRITGAVLRLEVIPHKTYGGVDYKFSFWLPNKTMVEGTDEKSVISFSDLMAKLVEAATGEKPKSGDEVKVVDANGFPLKVPDKDADPKDVIKIEETVYPLTEELKAFVEEKKTEPDSMPKPSLPGPTTTTTTSTTTPPLEVVWCPIINGWVERKDARWDDQVARWIPNLDEFGRVQEAKTRQWIQFTQLDSGAWVPLDSNGKVKNNLVPWDYGSGVA